MEVFFLQISIRVCATKKVLKLKIKLTNEPFDTKYILPLHTKKRKKGKRNDAAEQMHACIANKSINGGIHAG